MNPTLSERLRRRDRQRWRQFGEQSPFRVPSEPPTAVIAQTQRTLWGSDGGTAAAQVRPTHGVESAGVAEVTESAEQVVTFNQPEPLLRAAACETPGPELLHQPGNPSADREPQADATRLESAAEAPPIPGPQAELGLVSPSVASAGAPIARFGAPLVVADRAAPQPAGLGAGPRRMEILVLLVWMLLVLIDGALALRELLRPWIQGGKRGGVPFLRPPALLGGSLRAPTRLEVVP